MDIDTVDNSGYSRAERRKTKKKLPKGGHPVPLDKGGVPKGVKA